MCGFVGYLGGVEPAAAEKLLRRMTDSIAHRGPDEQGLFVCPSAGLGHARLSVVGLGDGQQPMASASGNLHIAFNGEIFNYVELRDELKARGRRFRTGSDTEVILHLYEEMGPDCVDVMNGDFAFAIWDEPRQRMFLARDRMGVRPLFYTEVRGALYFASEVKALLQVPGFTAELDEVALDQIFTLWAPIAPRTAFKNVRELEPGFVMIADRGGLTTRPYWQLDFPDAETSRAPRDEKAAAEELRALLTDATRIRMRADVTVGSYLSGGLDSSIVSALAAPMAAGGLAPSRSPSTAPNMTKALSSKRWPRRSARITARCLRRRRYRQRVFPEVIRFTERPILRTAPAPLYQLSGLVRAKGLESGADGRRRRRGLCRLRYFQGGLVRRFCARQPGSTIRPHLFRKLYPYLPGLKQQSAEYLAAFFRCRRGQP
jgi:asparagine synthase (glutamine-hydrolysing)